MTAPYETDRLLLRQWRDEDRAPFAAMNADERVMRYFPRLYSSDESDGFVDDAVRNIAEHGWGWWAVEVRRSGAFIGFVGLAESPPWHPCTGTIQIGWRLDPSHWGEGHATEAARRALEIGFDTLRLDGILAYTPTLNAPSIAVMRRLGMQDDGIGFEHPRIDADSPLRRHVVYRLSRKRRKTGGDAPVGAYAST